MIQNPTAQRKFKVKRVVILLAAVAAVVAGVAGVHAVQVRRQADVLLTRARAAADKQDWPASATLYQAYLNFRPEDTDAIVGYGETLEQWSKTRPAAGNDLIRVYERLLSLDPSRAEQRRKLARRYIEVGSYTGARNHLSALLEAGRPDPELYVMLATCAQGERKPAEAADNLRKAIAAAKENPSAGKVDPAEHLRLALILRNDFATQEAKREADGVMDALVKANPDDHRAWLTRSLYRTEAGDAKGAKDDLNRAYNLPGGAEDPDVVLALARTAREPTEKADARVALTKAVAAHPNHPGLRVALADLQTEANDREGARKTLAEAMPHAAVADALVIADRLIDLGDLATPAATAERFAQDPRRGFAADYLTGRVRLAQGNWPAALAALTRSLNGLANIRSAYVKAQLALAECYRQAGNPDERLKAYNAALAVDASATEALLGRAEALARTGQIPAAIKAYQAIVTQVPAARVELAKLRLAEQAARPEADRDWGVVEEALGPEPLAPELAVIKANELLLQNKQPDAVAYLEKRLRESQDRPVLLWVRLAEAKAAAGPEAGLAVIADADKTLGDRVELRLARAELTARRPNADPADVLALGNSAGAFQSPRDRYKLLAGLAEVMLALDRPKEAGELLRRAAAEQPYDLPSRMLMFEIAVATKDDARQQELLGELEKIEGPDGPSKVVAECTRAILAAKREDAPRIAAIRARVEQARAKRETWGRVYVLLGDLDLLEGNRDAAVDDYRRAVRLGERGDGVVRALVELLLERQGHQEALETLSALSRVGRLSPELSRQLNLLRATFGQEADRGLAWARSDAAARSQNPRDHLTRAAVFLGNNAPKDAEEALKMAVSRPEPSPEAWEFLVRFYAADGRMRDAVAAADKAAKDLKPAKDTPEDRAAVERAVGVCREVIEDPKGAEGHYRKAISTAPHDVAAYRQLALLLQRTGRRAEAEKLLAGLAGSDAPPAAKRWARRMLAFSKVDQPEGYAELPAALALVEENLKEGGNLLDDQRAKALLLAVDPLKRAESIALLVESAKSVPLPADQSFLLGRLYMLQNQPDRAEPVLRQATRAVGVAPPEYFALLVRAQLAVKDTAGAKQTVAKLKEVAPKAWGTLAEEARVLAATGRKADAGKMVVEAVGAGDAAALASRAGPLLEEIGCAEDAEKVYKDLAARGKTPAARVPLVAFYIRTGRQAEAMKIAWEQTKTDAPPALTARLLSGAARSRPLALVPEKDRKAWQADVEAADGWVREALKKDPKNPDLLFAAAELDDLFGRYDDEIGRYEQVLAADPDNEQALNNIALLLALHKLDATDRPLGYVNRAMAKRGPKPSYLDTRAVVHMAADRNEQAASDLNAALSLDPKAVYFYHLALAYHRQVAAKPELAKARDKAMKEAVARGLDKAMLHPKEWDKYEELRKLAGVK